MADSNPKCVCGHVRSLHHVVAGNPHFCHVLGKRWCPCREFRPKSPRTALPPDPNGEEEK